MAGGVAPRAAALGNGLLGVDFAGSASGLVGSAADLTDAPADFIGATAGLVGAGSLTAGPALVSFAPGATLAGFAASFAAGFGAALDAGLGIGLDVNLAAGLATAFKDLAAAGAAFLTGLTALVDLDGAALDFDLLGLGTCGSAGLGFVWSPKTGGLG